jgi:DnaJ family protein A protein 5
MTTKAMKTCYYELLEVERNSTQKDIDRAYKKAALKWHPDKNPDQDTTKIFQDVKEAYDVLSDPNERQWYDDHRD